MEEYKNWDLTAPGISFSAQSGRITKVTVCKVSSNRSFTSAGSAILIGYRFYNDGDQVGVGYGRQTCNPPARFLVSATSAAIADMIRALWQVTDEAAYERLLKIVTEMTMDYVDAHPELREQPAPDMWDYRDVQEDQDDYDDGEY